MPEDEGHEFHIVVAINGAYRLVGDEEIMHDDYATFLTPVVVRAWNLRDALVKAAELPLTDWFHEEDV